MPYINDDILDLALAELRDSAQALYICDTEPTNYVEATVTYALGNATSISLSLPQDRTSGGRMTQIAAISNGNVTANGTAQYWALVQTASGQQRVLSTGVLTPFSVTSGRTFTLNAIDIGIADAITG